MTDPFTQAIATVIAFVRQPIVAGPISLGLGLYAAYVLYRRTVDSSDPRYRKSWSTVLGSGVFLVSGAVVTAMFASIIAFLTWPLPADQPVFAAILVIAVVYHAGLEYREGTT